MKTVPPLSCGRPFEIAKCRTHRTANSYGMPLSYTAKCSCCHKFAQKEQLSVNFALVKIYYCGPQLASYLITVKYLAILLFLLCLVNALPLMLTNHKGKCCEKRLDCSPSFLLTYSVFNQLGQHKKINTQCYIVLANYILCIVFSQFLRMALRKIKKEIDETNLFPSQFAVFCKLAAQVDERAVNEAVQKWWMLEMKWNKKKMKIQFPQLFDQESENRKSVASHRGSLKIAQLSAVQPCYQFIEHIIFSYNHKEYLSRLKEMQEIEHQRPIGPFKINQSQVASKKSSIRLSRNPYCLIIFKSKQYADYFYRKNNPSIAEKLTCFDQFRYLYVNHQEVETARELYPCQISWNNHHLPKKEKRTLVMHTVGITLLLVIFSSAFISMFSVIYQRYLRERDNMMFHLYSFLIAIFINATVILGNQVISYFSDKEMHSNYVAHMSGLITKLVLFNVCTILASPLVILKTINTPLLWQSNGFIDIEVATMLLYMVITQMARYIYPSNIKTLKRYYDFLNNKNHDLTQEAANKMCDKPTHCIEQEYASIITIIICTLFLTSFVPFITIAACIWMLLQYWLERANISYYYKEDDFHSHHLNMNIIALLQLSFSFLLLGCLTIYIISSWYFDFKFQINVILLFGVLLAYALLSLLLPLEKINTYVFDLCMKNNPNEEGYNDNLYKTAKNSFLSFYEDFNEAYMLQKNIENTLTEKRINASEQLRTIQASLSHSLKERLLNQAPIITQNNDQNQQYFEYEKKINMKKAHPKVSIPPLFNNASELRKAAIFLKSEVKHNAK